MYDSAILTVIFFYSFLFYYYNYKLCSPLAEVSYLQQNNFEPNL